MCDIDGMKSLESSNLFAKHYVNMVKAELSITAIKALRRFFYCVAEYNYC